MTRRTIRSFTLLELIAVITIVAMITGLVSQRIGKTPAFMAIEDLVARIESLAQNAAKRSIMQSKKLGIFFNNEDRKLFIGTDRENALSERGSAISLPDEAELNYENMESDDPVFSFFPDGTGDGVSLKLTFKAHERIVYISPLTGTLDAYEPEQ